MWFEKLTGFKEESPNQVRANLQVKGETLTSLVNGRSWNFGRLEVPHLESLRETALVTIKKLPSQNIKVSEIVGNVQIFHKQKENQGALFQAASQFNLLEMVGPEVVPERGVGIYSLDHTQGPACAIACGAGTIYRNYFAEVNGQTGQTREHQVDCLENVGGALQNEDDKLWTMRNGYALANKQGLKNITEQIKALDAAGYETLKGKLKIGLQWDTEVTIDDSAQRVTQAYCSALPVAYSLLDESLWETFARLVLEATYEATLAAGVINLEQTGCNKVFLTLVGGGAFGNDTVWITDAIKQAIRKFENTGLDIRIVSYGRSSSRVKRLVNEISQGE
ncbi:hypothetical protein [Microscilla marina]|uniref:Uncharacterized protein n=1 Tax=Microscilla marina ATCC 23134 TaxID=313606 RepID=A1ZGU3_MICM2|nr:hypothetical protein [Microscilla marina]EAY30212.1 conserved hypothetical protein [Microscilla marina ATCC 23134]